MRRFVCKIIGQTSILWILPASLSFSQQATFITADHGSLGHSLRSHQFGETDGNQRLLTEA
jgi:hypothetical protein